MFVGFIAWVIMTVLSSFRGYGLGAGEYILNGMGVGLFDVLLYSYQKIHGVFGCVCETIAAVAASIGA